MLQIAPEEGHKITFSVDRETLEAMDRLHELSWMACLIRPCSNSRQQRER
jgi:hypothetical protein